MPIKTYGKGLKVMEGLIFGQQIHCCRDCTPATGRSPSCHGTCVKYQSARKEADIKRDRDNKISKNERDWCDYILNNHTKGIKRRREKVS